MKTKISRRGFIRAGAYAAVAAAASYTSLIESEWVEIKEVNLTGGDFARTIVHITDLHYKGNGDYLERVIRKINALRPEFVCFTGDTVEGDTDHLNEALDFLKKINCPLFGVPGNHDYACRVPFDVMKTAFAKTGGAWLVDESVRIPEKGIELVGIDGMSLDYFSKNNERKSDSTRRLLLVHYPKFADQLGVVSQKMDLILAGHSHGGQIRAPFIGPLILPPLVGRYDRGLFQTPSGPLYVNPGIGTYFLPVRFNCRPEITVIRL